MRSSVRICIGRHNLRHHVNSRRILGPVYTICINDIAQVVKIAKFVLYADDANIIISGNTIAGVSQKLSEISKD